MNGLILLYLYVVGSAANINEYDILASKSSLMFIDNWLESPTRYITLVLPSRYQFTENNVQHLTKNILKGMRSTPYIRVSFNMTEYDFRQTQNELVWFPFGIEKYNMEYYCSRAMSKNTSRKKHFLFFTRTKQNVDTYFNFCKIRFDSNVVVYYTVNKPNSVSFVYFEEIYKIKEKKDEKLKKNVLGKFTLNSNIFNLVGLKSSIWNRRRN